MLKIEIDSDNNLFTVTPVGGLSESDFAGLTESVNGYINERDQVPNLLIVAGGIPHWDSFAALLAHARFIRGHHRVIAKVAIVGDSAALSIFPALVDHFVSAKVRHFSQDGLERAREWAIQEEDHPGAFALIPGLPDDVIAIEAKGIITSQDYAETLTPLVEEKLKLHGHLKVLCVLGAEFESFSQRALWDDARLGFMHFRDFSKLAIVSDIAWVRGSVKLFAPFMPAAVHVFHLAELDDAKDWIRA